VPMDYTAAGLAACGFPADQLVQSGFGGANNVNVQPNGTLKNAADGLPLVGSTIATAPSSTAYSVFGGTNGGGDMGYPRSSYSPLTNDLYICAKNAATGWAKQGNSTNYAQLKPPASVGIQGYYLALNLSTNKIAWRNPGMANTTGLCYSGSLSTGGNLAVTAWAGRTDITGAAAVAAGVGGEMDIYNASTGGKLFSYPIPGSGWSAPAVTYTYKGKQYIAIYHNVPAAGPGSTATGQVDQLTVFSL